MLNNKVRRYNLQLSLVVITTLIGPIAYLGFASLYHFVITILFAIALFKGISLNKLDSGILIFLFVWVIESFISVVWAPDKSLAIQYVYYIGLIFLVCVLFHIYIDKNNLNFFIHLMVWVLFACNIIALWEVTTGNHLVKDYLSGDLRHRLFEFVPGAFYRNPNDFATYIIQILPFSLVSCSSSKKSIRIISIINVILSFFTVFATQSRTQIILILIIYVAFALLTKKTIILRFALIIPLVLVLLSIIYPTFKNMLFQAWSSISSSEIISSAEGGSLGARFALLKNGFHILFDTAGFGIGAGCHRAVMPDYSFKYYYTDDIVVMHNLIGEILVDYGLIIGIAFVIVIISSIVKLIMISSNANNYMTKQLSALLAISMTLFIICGLSSSSILQLTSIWMTICFISVFIRLYSKRPENRMDYYGR